MEDASDLSSDACSMWVQVPLAAFTFTLWEGGSYEKMQEGSYIKYCKKCKSNFSYTKEDVVWDENSSYGSTKLVKCSKCGKYLILKEYMDKFDNINDQRFYSYN